jgi:hypothetical protein
LEILLFEIFLLFLALKIPPFTLIMTYSNFGCKVGEREGEIKKRLASYGIFGNVLACSFNFSRFLILIFKFKKKY